MRKNDGAAAADLQIPEELIGALRTAYLADCREKVGLIRTHAQALSTRAGFKTAFPILLFVTHQLKGSGGSYGFMEISETARVLHRRLSDHLELGESTAVLSDLSEEISDLASRLEAAILKASAGR